MFSIVVNGFVPVFAAFAIGVFLVACFLSVIGYFDVWEKRHKTKQINPEVARPQYLILLDKKRQAQKRKWL